ncbi:DUF2306 domain-containing protein [Massilia sp. SM-13]|uniref:DUF2306 domain-containing protein n=1 Tax=Pseudoduganella rhizocola TaxID=3382643 RepID=UPI0038B62387
MFGNIKSRQSPGRANGGPAGPWPRQECWLLAGLLLLAAVPILAAASRLYYFGSNATHPALARFSATPAPMIVHLLSASLFALLGAWQLIPSARLRAPRRHARLGQLAWGAGLLAALSACWALAVYPVAATDPPPLSWLRALAAAGLALCLLAGMHAGRRRHYAAHRAWMLRAYALGLGAGTQVLTHLPFLLGEGAPPPAARLLCMAAGWLINLAVAEYLLRRPTLLYR